MLGVEAYLQRLGVHPRTGAPSVSLLADLQVAHMVHVPFENLHVYHGRRPGTDAEWSVHKVVDERRGGWCFELNGAFGTLLRALGFTVDHVSCQVWEADPGRWGPDFDHLGSIVHLDGERWFVDVGFGDCCLEPLLVDDVERPAVPRRVRTELDPGHLVLHELMPRDDGTEEWEPQLRIALRPRQLRDFDARSTHLQTCPGLSWQEKPFATRALDRTGSRVTLRSDVLRRRTGTGPFVDEPVTRKQWSEVLLRNFGLTDHLRD